MVSVLLPFHHASPTLNAAIRSIAGQSFLDRELLFLNNAWEVIKAVLIVPVGFWVYVFVSTVLVAFMLGVR